MTQIHRLSRPRSQLFVSPLMLGVSTNRRFRMKSPPKGLDAAGRALWRQVAKWAGSRNVEFDEHEFVILTEACHVADRLSQVAEALDGWHPADPTALRLLVEERQQRQLLSLLLVTRLGLPTGIVTVDPAKGVTPRSRRAQTAARARWGDAS